MILIYMIVTVAKNQCITPKSNDKSIFYLTFDLPKEANANEVYEPGDWLTIQATNRPEMVSAILLKLGLTGNENIEIRRAGLVNCKQALQQHLELTQLNPAILNKLQRQFGFNEWPDRQAMIDYAYGKDILDLLESFPQLQQQGLEFLNLLSPLAPRYYSIASAPNESNTVSILYRKVDYLSFERQRFGVASCMLAELEVGQKLDVEFKNNPTFKLPQDPETPVIMVGSGTGLAPFIGFMQQRALQEFVSADDFTDKRTGLEKRGLNYLFFGETHKESNCLFCSQLEAWQEQGVLQTYFAFSRDQAEKVYVQDQLNQQRELVWSLLNRQAHLYICGSQTTMAESVKETLLTIFEELGGLDAKSADDFWHELRKQKRLQMDVY